MSWVAPKLFPYQRAGVEFLLSKKRALLADEMGLGKSAQAINAWRVLPTYNPCVVVCPAVVVTNWIKEFEKFANVKAQSNFEKWDRKSPLVMSYAGLRSRKFKHPIGCLILDEVHYLKNAKSKRTQSILGKTGCAHMAERIWGLSGTPIPNHAGEIWPILYTFGVTSKSYNAFVKRYCTFYGGIVRKDTGWVTRVITGTNEETIEELNNLIAPIMLRRKASDELNLPEIFYQDLQVPDKKVKIPIDYLTPEEVERVEALGASLPIESIDFDYLSLNAPSLSTFRRYCGIKKALLSAEIVKEELSSKSYQKIIIFCHHQAVAKIWRDALWEFNPVLITGQDSPQKRDTHIELFQTVDRCHVAICSIQAAGVGINLTKADQVLFSELDYVPGNNAQSLKRAHRIGREKPLFVRFLSMRSSIDDVITRILKRKTQQILQIMEGKEANEIGN